MNFTIDDWNILKKLGYRRKVSYSFGNYYTKGTSLEKAFNELVGQKICQKLGLMCPDYQIVASSDFYYVLSEDLNQENIFFAANEMGITEEINSSLASIWQFLQAKYYNAETLMFEVIKMYLMDIFFNNVDRDETNWGVLFTDDKRELVALDHECLLDRGNFNNIKSYVTHEDGDFGELKRKNIEYFLNQSGEYGEQLFNYFLETFTPEDVEQMLKEICKEEKIITMQGEKKLNISIKYINEILDRYEENYDMFKEIARRKDYGRK